MVLAFPYAHNFTRRRMDQSSGGRQARRALKTAFTILDSASDSPEGIYTHIYKAVISYINHKTGSNKVEYSTGEITEIIKSHNEAKLFNEIENILARGEAVRFAQISSQDAQNDLLGIKNLLKEIDADWS
jgi:hypothetical protein